MPNDVINIETMVIGEKNSDHIMGQDKETRSCDFCGKDFRQKLLLKPHVQIHTSEGGFLCDECEFSCVSKGRLHIHKQSEHEGIMYQCDLCEFSHKLRHQLKVHISVKHEGKVPAQKFECDQCSFKSAGKTNLKKLIQTKLKGFRFTHFFFYKNVVYKNI